MIIVNYYQSLDEEIEREIHTAMVIVDIDDVV